MAIVSHSGASDVKWFAQLYADNPGYMEIWIDTRDLVASYADNVRMDINLLDKQNSVLEKQHVVRAYPFDRGSVHVIYEKCDRPEVVAVSGVQILYDLQIPGLKFLIEPDDTKLRQKEWRTIRDRKATPSPIASFDPSIRKRDPQETVPAAQK